MKHWTLLLLLSRAAADTCLQQYCGGTCRVTATTCATQSDVTDQLLVWGRTCPFLEEWYGTDDGMVEFAMEREEVTEAVCGSNMQCPNGYTQEEGDGTTCVPDCPNGYTQEEGDGTACVPDCSQPPDTVWSETCCVDGTSPSALAHAYQALNMCS